MQSSAPVFYCGDPHGDFGRISQALTLAQRSTAILLGDMEPTIPLQQQFRGVLHRIWYIHGNHDTDTSQVAELVFDSEVADRNTHGRVVTLSDGTRLAGLGGVFRGAVWNPGIAPGVPKYRTRAEHARATPRQDRWRGSVHLKHWSTIYPEDIERLAKLRADVLVMHEAPKSAHPHGFEILGELARTMGVKLVVHGHHHDALDSSDQWQRQGFKSFGVGLRGVTAIDLDGDFEVIVRGESGRR